jgi:riboflavin kinase / FMN adenylyltransferase
MEVVRDFEKWQFVDESIVTIGTFDGVHRGHQKLLQKLNNLKQKKGGKSIVFTFDPHPRKVLFPGQTDLQLLSDLDEKTELIKAQGIDILIIYPFTKEFAQIEPERFISEILIGKLKVRTLVIGYDHKFGKDRKGDINTFKAASAKYGFEVEEIPAQEINDINVSSTKVRRALFEGDISAAHDFLGYNYFLHGEVVHGKKLGKTISFPTANISVKDKDKLIPRKGVYLVGVELEGFKGCGMMNIGTNPTTDTDENLKLEVNIFNFDKDIYGRTIRIEFMERLRDEKKFDSVEELINAIKEDEKNCKRILNI